MQYLLKVYAGERLEFQYQHDGDAQSVDKEAKNQLIYLHRPDMRVEVWAMTQVFSRTSDEAEVEHIINTV